MELLKQIQEFGLTEIEAKIYLSLLNIGEGTVLELARNTGIKRATVHFNVENLISKSLISQTKKNNKRILIAEDPSNLKLLITKKKSELEKLEKDLPSILSGFQSNLLDNKKGFTMQVKYFEGRESVKTIYTDALSGSGLRSFVNLSLASKIFPENHELFVDRVRNDKDFEIFEIFESTQVEQYKSSVGSSTNFHYKYAPNILKIFASDILIYNGKVAVVALKENVSGMIMENMEYFEFSKGMFDYIWETIQ
jgi:sugar-specific transcriptional regulator TrmB